MKDRENVLKVVMSSNVFFFFLLVFRFPFESQCKFKILMFIWWPEGNIQVNQQMFEQIRTLRCRITNLEKNKQFF